MEINFAPFACVLVAITLDIVSGIIKAGATNTMSSGIMRSGLWHKSALILLEAVAFCSSFAPGYIEGLPSELGVVYIAITAYICLMELVSILENLAIANPQLSANKIFQLFGIVKDEQQEN